MRDDYELLKLAAKAAGLDVVWDDYQQEHALYDEDGVLIGGWDPLTYDGDALRLAVKLGISPEWGGFDIEVCRKHSGARNFCYVEPHGDDPYAATRRAIVRAAAEIGKVGHA